MHGIYGTLGATIITFHGLDQISFLCGLPKEIPAVGKIPALHIHQIRIEIHQQPHTLRLELLCIVRPFRVVVPVQLSSSIDKENESNRHGG